MGNTLCKPVPEQLIEQQPKNVEPLLTEEAIKILNVENEKKSEIVVSKATVLSETIEPVISVNEIKATVTETLLEPVLEPVISAATETVLSETIEPVLEPVISAATETVLSETIEPVVTEPLSANEIAATVTESTEETLSLIQPPDESSSTSSKDEIPEPPKKKRGRKRKCDQ